MTRRFTIPWPGKAKARPRVTRKGTYMPPEYRAWREQVAQFLALNNGQHPAIDGPVEVEMSFHTDRVEVAVRELDPVWKRPRKVRADIDNLIGGVMDAMVDGGVIVDDRVVLKVTAVALADE